MLNALDENDPDRTDIAKFVDLAQETFFLFFNGTL
jgi:hypothetical protein